MIIKHAHFLKSLALSPLLIAMFPSYAQEESKTSVDSNVEVIEVTGFRGSLTEALNTKRFSKNVVDAIAAEDVGKSTDQNIAEALQRVTGVSIGRGDGGEGTNITIRGAGSDLNNVTLNGVTLTSSGSNQGIDFSQFSADMLADIEVIKTPSADHDEGSLGASVRLNGFKPLDSKKDRRSVTLEYRKNPFADTKGGPDHRVNISLSEKFLDDTLGLSIVATTQDQTRRTDKYDNNSFRKFEVSGRRIPSVTNIQTGEIISEYDLDGDGTLEPIWGHGNRQNRYSYDFVTRDSEQISTSLQYRPADNTDIQLDYTFSTQKSGKDAAFFTNTTPVRSDEPEDALWDPNTFTFVKLVNTSTRNNESVGIRNHRDISETTQENSVLGLQVTHTTESAEFSLRGGHSKSTSDDDFFLRNRFGTPNSLRGTGVYNGYDCTLISELCLNVISEGHADDPENFTFGNISLRDRVREDVSTSVYFDVDWDVELGPITQIETGLKWNKREKDNQETNRDFNNGQLGNVARDSTLTEFFDGEFSPSDWGEGLGFPRDHITDGWVLPDSRKALEFLRNEGVEPDLIPDPLNSRTIEQVFTAAYVKANFEFFDGELFGDVGVRYAHTDVKAFGSSGFRFSPTGFTTEVNNAFFGSPEATLAALGIGIDINDRDGYPTAISDDNSYDNVLPSLNLNYLLTDDMILRFAASKTIARPRIDDLKPGFRIAESAFSIFSNGQLGATDLAPFQSTNFDLSFEWYFTESSLFSATLFNKDFSDFTERGSYLAYWTDIRSEFYNADGSLKPAEEVDFSASVDEIITRVVNEGDPQPTNCMPNREGELDAASVGCDLLNVNSLRNGQGGYIRGLELGFQHNFSNLPGIWSGLGFLTNYTYSDSQQDEETTTDDDGTVRVTFQETAFEGTSEHTFNSTVYWEKDGKTIRLAYNNRSDYLVERVSTAGYASWIEGFDTLDFSANWQVNKILSFSFQATNLTDTVTRRYASNYEGSLLTAESVELGNAPSFRTSRLQNNGTTYRLSARFNF